MSIYDERTYQNKNVLEEMLNNGLSVKQMSKQLHISYKLVNYWLIKHGLVVRTPEIKLP